MTEFLIKILTGAHTRVKILKSCQNIDDWSKIYQTDLIRQYFESMYFLTKNLPHTVKNLVKILTPIFCFEIFFHFFDRIRSPKVVTNGEFMEII